jgi:hypothetical protein
MEKVEYAYIMKRKWESQHLVEKENAEAPPILRASPEMLTMGLAKVFLTSKFGYLTFCNPAHKTETDTGQRQIGGRLLIANHLD